MTTFSPSTVGRVATRMSSMRPAAAALSEMRPSCGFRRSAMSSFASTFRRVVTPGVIRFGIRCISWSTPSMRKRTASASSCGSKWTSEAPSSAAWKMTELTSRTSGASETPSSTSRSSVLLLGAPQLLVDLLEDRAGAERLGGARHPAQLDEDVLARGDAEVERDSGSRAGARRCRAGCRGRRQRSAACRSRAHTGSRPRAPARGAGSARPRPCRPRRARGRRARPGSGQRASERFPPAARRPRRRSPARASPGLPARGPSPACRRERARSPRAGRRRARPSRSQPCPS